MNDNADDISKLESKIRQLRAEMDGLVAAAVRRTNTMRVILVIASLAMLGYFSFIYSQLSTIDADLAANLAQRELSTYIEDGGKKLVETGKEKADELLDAAEEFVLKQPSSLSTFLTKQLDSQLDEHVPKLEAEMSQGLRDLIVSAAEKAHEHNGGKPLNEGDFQTFVDQLSEQYNKDVMEMLAKMHGMYRESADPLLGYFEHLATGKDLTEREKHHKELVTDTLMLLYKHMLDSGKEEGGDLPPKPQGPA